MTKYLCSKPKLTMKSNDFIKKCRAKFEEMDAHKIVDGMIGFIW